MSNIEWTGKTWNPVVGCTPVSPGCLNCYAATMARRLERIGTKGYEAIPNHTTGGNGTLRIAEVRGGRAVFTGEVRTLEDRLTIPFGWRKPRTIFVNSMSDLFHEDVPFEFIDRVFAVMALTPRHTYQILTKRPDRMAEYLNTTRQDLVNESLGLGEWREPEDRPSRADAVMEAVFDDHDDDAYPDHTWWIRKGRGGLAGYLLNWPLPNVWLGTSVEDQARADERIPHLLRCPAAVRFLSCEPLLGPVDLQRNGAWGCFEGKPAFTHGDHADWLRNIHWVIAGGESGHGARPCDIDWIRSIVQQCKGAGVPVFVKQCGEVVRWNGSQGGYMDGTPNVWPDGTKKEDTGNGWFRVLLKNKKGGDPAEWPEDLRIREMPKTETTR